MVRMRYYLRIMEATALYFEIEIRQSEMIDYFSAWPTRKVYWKNKCVGRNGQEQCLALSRKIKRNLTKDNSLPSDTQKVSRILTPNPTQFDTHECFRSFCIRLKYPRRLHRLPAILLSLEVYSSWTGQDTLVAASSSNILHTLAIIPITMRNHPPRQFSGYYPLP